MAEPIREWEDETLDQALSAFLPTEKDVELFKLTPPDGDGEPFHVAVVHGKVFSKRGDKWAAEPKITAADLADAENRLREWDVEVVARA